MPASLRPRARPRTVVVTGAGGQLGRACVDAFGASPLTAVVGFDRRACDCGDFDMVMQMVVPAAPDVVVNCAAWTDVDGCEADPDRAFRDNALAVRNLRTAAARSGADLVQMSTDYVFSGVGTRPWREWDRPDPQSEYGRSKLAGDHEALAYARSVVVRASWIVGDGRNFARNIFTSAVAGDPLAVVDDQRGRPTLARDLAMALVAAATGRRYGLWHVANTGDCTWHDFAVEVVRLGGFDTEVARISSADLDRPAPRPAYSVLDDHLWRAAGLPPLPRWQDSLARDFDLVTGRTAEVSPDDG